MLRILGVVAQKRQPVPILLLAEQLLRIDQQSLRAASRNTPPETPRESRSRRLLNHLHLSLGSGAGTATAATVRSCARSRRRSSPRPTAPTPAPACPSPAISSSPSLHAAAPARRGPPRSSGNNTSNDPCPARTLSCLSSSLISRQTAADRILRANSPTPGAAAHRRSNRCGSSRACRNLRRNNRPTSAPPPPSRADNPPPATTGAPSTGS